MGEMAIVKDPIRLASHCSEEVLPMRLPGISAKGGVQKPRASVFSQNTRPKAGEQVVAQESLDSLAYHLCLVALAVAVALCAKAVSALAFGDVLNKFPLFPFCLASSLILQVAVLPRIQAPVDTETMDRILNTSQDIMIVAAIPLVNFQELSKQGIPFLVASMLSLIWEVLAFFYLAPRLLNVLGRACRCGIGHLSGLHCHGAAPTPNGRPNWKDACVATTRLQAGDPLPSRGWWYFRRSIFEHRRFWFLGSLCVFCWASDVVLVGGVDQNEA